MKVDVASPEKVFGLQASRPPKWPSSPPPSPVTRLALPRRSQTERQHVEVCSLLPQRDCCRLPRHSLILRRNAKARGLRLIQRTDGNPSEAGNSVKRETERRR